MSLTLRQETIDDRPAVARVIVAAFAGEPESDQSEPQLVERLRRSAAFVPELSVVAEKAGKIVGHVLLTKIQITNETDSFGSLALAPVSVRPDFQCQGIGEQLIREVHRRATALGYGSIVLIGHADYYPRFGYEPADKYGVKFPFPAPAENCMVIELREHALKGVSGAVKYDPAFFEQQ